MRAVSMRAIAIAVWFVVLLVSAAAPAGAQRSGEPQTLQAFAQSLGLREVDAFVETVQSLRASKSLPPRYVTKEAASAHGWRGGGLCGAWPGHAVAGDGL